VTIVLLESLMKFTLMDFRPRGHDICILDLLHGCDNMINRLANKPNMKFSYSTWLILQSMKYDILKPMVILY
jgi:hypothetical protein